MKLSVIALDYDGTVARGDSLDPSVREAIAAARTQGITVLLVTGRLLDDLRRVAGDLHFVDGVIAENGAIVHLPTAAGPPRWLRAYRIRLSSNCGVDVSPVVPHSASLTPMLTTHRGCSR